MAKLGYKFFGLHGRAAQLLNQNKPLKSRQKGKTYFSRFFGHFEHSLNVSMGMEERKR